LGFQWTVGSVTDVAEPESQGLLAGLVAIGPTGTEDYPESFFKDIKIPTLVLWGDKVSISPIFHEQLFLYESFLRSFYVLTIWVCIFLVKGFWRKSCS
jgi:hypothetical protein